LFGQVLLPENTHLTFFADTDTVGYDGLMIGDVTLSATNGLFTWNAENLDAGQYWIYGVLDDGKLVPLLDYSENSMTVRLLLTQPAAINYIDTAFVDTFTTVRVRL
jgi:hypothetical protein